MNPKFILEQSIQRCERLSRVLHQVESLPMATEAAMGLESELQDARASKTDRPPVVLVAGGTGVGKSALFANLAGLDRADLSSDIQRPFTRRPNVAAVPGERFISVDDRQVNYVEGSPGLVLIDSPDVDSTDEENKVVTRQLVGQADIILYVTIADKRASEDVLREMREWGPRARWLFALNKVDLLRPEDLDLVREDMLEKLRELGFQVRPGDCFLTSAINGSHPSSELGRLRNAIYSAPQQQVKLALKAQTALRKVENSLQGDAFEQLEALCLELGNAEDEMKARVRGIYLEALGARKTSRSLQGLVREAAWRELPHRIGGPLALAVWVRSRLSNIWLTYSVARLTTSPLSITSWLRVAMSGFGSLARGMLPLRTLLHAFQPEHWRRLASVEREAVRRLEDLGMNPPAEITTAPQLPDEADAPDKDNLVRLVRSLLDSENSPEQRARVQAAEMLDEAIAEHAQQTADRVAGWPPKIFGNLLPWALVLHFAYRLGAAWMEGTWLPFDFYLHGLVMFLLSLIPGWLQLGVRMRSLAEAPEPEAVLRYLHAPSQTAAIRRIHDECETLLREVAETRNFVSRQRKRLGVDLKELPGSEFSSGHGEAESEDQHPDQPQAQEDQ